MRKITPPRKFKKSVQKIMDEHTLGNEMIDKYKLNERPKKKVRKSKLK